MKIFNCGKKVSVYQHEGHIQSRIVYFLMNLQVSQVRRRGQSYDEFSAPDNLLVPPWSEWVQRSRQTWWGQRADWVWQVGENWWSETCYHLANVRQYSRKLGEYINSLEVTNQWFTFIRDRDHCYSVLMKRIPLLLCGLPGWDGLLRLPSILKEGRRGMSDISDFNRCRFLSVGGKLWMRSMQGNALAWPWRRLKLGLEIYLQDSPTGYYDYSLIAFVQETWFN